MHCVHEHELHAQSAGSMHVMHALHGDLTPHGGSQERARRDCLRFASPAEADWRIGVLEGQRLRVLRCTKIGMFWIIGSLGRALGMFQGGLEGYFTASLGGLEGFGEVFGMSWRVLRRSWGILGRLGSPTWRPRGPEWGTRGAQERQSEAQQAPKRASRAATKQSKSSRRAKKGNIGKVAKML